MNTIIRISASYVLAAAACCVSPAVLALGLGDATVDSFLNQPLQARIDLLTRETDDLTSVSAKLASADDYELIGASRESVSVPISFTIENIEGDAYILATSDLPLANPVVRLIVEVEWSSGRLLREYTLFLDPATYTEPAPLPRVDQREPERAPETAESPPPVAPQAPAEEEPVAPERAVSAGSGTADEYGPVKNGETLWGIASDWARGSGMDINKVMIAIQRENPNAFMRDNINLLKRGAILRMPDAESVNAISRTDAFSEVSSQEEEFASRHTEQAAASTATPLLAEESAAVEPETAETEPVVETAADAVSETTEGAAEDQEIIADSEEPEAEAPDDTSAAAEETSQLELVPPSEASDLDSAYGFEESETGEVDASVSVSALREDLARREEELINQQQQNAYLEERIRELESQLEAAEEATVEDADLANMEARLREERQSEEQKRQQVPATRSEDQPWYGGFTLWLIGLLLVAAAVAGWMLSRRRGDEFVSDLGTDEEQLQEIKDEAEEVLRVLEDSEEPADGAEEEAETGETEIPEELETEDGEESSEKAPAGLQEDAEVLDEDSSDPEIQLDLARAYISMGDKEAARVILEEVASTGSEEQQAEARSMMDQL